MDESTWDLESLYRGFDDPQLAADRARAVELADDFAAAYTGKVAALDGPGLRRALQDLEALRFLTMKGHTFSYLKMAEATDSDAARACFAAQTSFDAQVNQKLAFFQVELSALPDGHLDALQDEGLEQYRHWLELDRQYAPYTLSADAEATTTRKDVTGKSAWVNLYTQVTDGLTFEVEVDGEVQKLTRSEVSALYSESDPALRRRAREALIDGFAPQRQVLTFVFDTLFEDHRLDYESRGYDDAMHRSIIDNDVQRPVVEALLTTATGRFDLVHRYHALRKGVMGLDAYTSADLMAPPFGDEPEIPWEEARQLVIDAFAAFAPEVGQWARSFLDRRRVDVFPRRGKSGGAFCAPGYPPQEPYVLMNYAGRLDDVFTLAHEFGHALHFTESLVQKPLNYWTGMCLAETASVFAEGWLHEHLMKLWPDARRQRQLLDRQVRSACQTAFHQIAYVNWERAAHEARLAGSLTGEAMGELWTAEMGRLFGPAVQLDAGDAWRWMTIPHFVFARFYCYSYAFGKLLTLALQSLWRERGDAFVADYRALLAAGGSRSPVDLVGALGLDLSDPAFWNRGCDEVERYLVQLEALAGSEL